MKNKILAPIILMIAILFLAGCSSGTTNGTTSNSAFLGGTQGIAANFEAFGVQEDSIYTIFDTESFPLEVTLVNKGEYALQPGDVTVKLLGPSQQELEGISSWELKNQDAIEPISDLVPNGGQETINFAADAKFKSPVTGFLDREWFANLDYKYQTQLIIPEVCLKEDPTDDRVCTVDESKTFFVSGAPVTVTSVVESTAGRGIMALTISLSNVAGGKVAKLGEDFGVVEKLGYSIDDPAWECKSSGRVDEARLTSGTADIICKLKDSLEDGALSTKQVKLTLEYTYRDLIQETLRIKSGE